MLWASGDLLASIRFTVIPPNVLASLRLIIGEVNDQWCCPSKDEGRSTFAPCDWMNLFAVVADSPEYRCMRSRACALSGTRSRRARMLQWVFQDGSWCIEIGVAELFFCLFFCSIFSIFKIYFVFRSGNMQVKNRETAFGIPFYFLSK
jgi:hypothetical protein